MSWVSTKGVSEAFCKPARDLGRLGANSTSDCPLSISFVFIFSSFVSVFCVFVVLVFFYRERVASRVARAAWVDS